ncbi:unnamed protein product [Microthlaspi erraticum]|uniref:Uncharacterized protein n=1 Tax=Microthlaspi erraticum TaxID=1685480 RepID=A0A6D2HVP1_9BRAS|nr:unnamed protein product [Microthlaspi erraticum]
MSRKGVIAKRVKTAPDGSIENQRPTRSPAGRGTNVPRSAKHIRPSEVSAKVPNHRPITITTRETLSRGRPSTTSRHAAHDHAARAGNKPRGRATTRVPRPMHPSEPGKNVPRPAEKPSAKFIRPTTPADREIIRPRPFRLGPRPDCPADRPDRPSERRGRPEAVFEAQSAQFKPKAGADLARLGLAAFHT